jgi:hypothetical protein
MSEEFTESLVNLMETYNQWSGATHKVNFDLIIK